MSSGRPQQRRWAPSHQQCVRAALPPRPCQCRASGRPRVCPAAPRGGLARRRRKWPRPRQGVVGGASPDRGQEQEQGQEASWRRRVSGAETAPRGETGSPRSAPRAAFAERPPRVSAVRSESSCLAPRRREEPRCPARRRASQAAETPPQKCGLTRRPASSLCGLEPLVPRPPGLVSGVCSMGLSHPQLYTCHNEGR